ncbi:MAG: DUF2066 domain-containing protein [Aquisalimonadaceae bacterium]
MKSVCRLGGLLLVLLPVLLLGQSGPAGLFDARVTVEGEGAQERREATRAGLMQVLERLTGRRDVIEQPDVEEVLAGAEGYLQQYNYEQTTGEDGETERQLNLRFDGAAVERALSDRRIAVWSPEDRPRILVWLATDRGAGRELIGGDRGLEVQQLLRRTASERGLPVLLPLLDLEDQQAMRASDLWGGFREPVLAASERYRTSAVLVGRLSERGGNWRGRWVLFWDDETYQTTVSDERLEVVMASAADGVSGFLAERLSGLSTEGAGSVIYIRFEGMRSLAEYAWAQQLLSGVRGVVRADPSRVNERFTDYRVEIDAESSRVLRALQQSGRVDEADIGSDAQADEQGSGRNPDYFFRMR